MSARQPSDAEASDFTRFLISLDREIAHPVELSGTLLIFGYAIGVRWFPLPVRLQQSRFGRWAARLLTVVVSLVLVGGLIAVAAWGLQGDLWSSISRIATASGLLQPTWSRLFLGTFAVGLVVVVHELGHLIALVGFQRRAARFRIGFTFRLPAPRIDITEIWSLRKSQQILVILAGPAVSLAAGVIAAAVTFHLQASTRRELVALVSFAGTLDILNLLPAKGLDGGTLREIRRFRSTVAQ